MPSPLSTLQWIEILQNPKITYDFDIAIFQVIYSFVSHRGYASQVGLALGYSGKAPHSNINSEIGRYAKRIAKYYDINYETRITQKYKFIDLFFTGAVEGHHYYWQIRPELLEALQEVNHIDTNNDPMEIPEAAIGNLFEGAKKTVIVNSYERNYRAIMICTRHWGAVCSVCGFDFEAAYGPIGKGFINVHHLIPVSQIGKTYQINPIEDLRPVCPNCHAMLHKRNPAYSIEELKDIINL